MDVKRRTFEAKNHPKGSAERARLNCSPLTSEYMPSYKYTLMDNGKDTCWQFRTRSEAEGKAAQ